MRQPTAKDIALEKRFDRLEKSAKKIIKKIRREANEPGDAGYILAMIIADGETDCREIAMKMYQLTTDAFQMQVIAAIKEAETAAASFEAELELKH